MIKLYWYNNLKLRLERTSDLHEGHTKINIYYIIIIIILMSLAAQQGFWKKHLMQLFNKKFITRFQTKCNNRL